MIGRRGFLGFLLSSPITGAVAVKEAANGLSSGLAATTVCDGPTAPVENRPSLLERMFDKARKKDERRRDVRGTQVRHLPPHIAERKSWSTAYKHHVFRQELDAQIEWWNHMETLTDKQRRAMIRKVGLNI